MGVIFNNAYFCLLIATTLLAYKLHKHFKREYNKFNILSNTYNL